MALYKDIFNKKEVPKEIKSKIYQIVLASAFWRVGESHGSD